MKQVTLPALPENLSGFMALAQPEDKSRLWYASPAVRPRFPVQTAAVNTAVGPCDRRES